MSTQPPPADPDPIGTAVRTVARPRMTPHEIGFMLATAARIPAVYLCARDRLAADLFEPDEARFVLLWRSVVAAADGARHGLPADPAAAREVVAVHCAAEIETDPSRRYYTPSVERAVLVEGGLLDEVYALPVDPAVEDKGIDLVARFVTERRVGDPLRRALAGLSTQDTIADPAALIAVLDKHAADVAGIRTDPGSEAVIDGLDFLPPGPNLFTTKVKHLDELLGGGQASKECYVILGPTSGGKCLAKGTPVLMFDGSIRAVEDVAVGDQLMGPDSTPRTVLRLGRGREMMYRVRSTRGDDAYVVNESHILSLKQTADHDRPRRVVNLTVRDYLTRSPDFRRLARGWRTGVDYPARPVPVDPYFLGLWLAGGHSRRVSVCKPDPEVEAAVAAVAAAEGLTVTNFGGDDRCPEWAITGGQAGGRAYPLLDKMWDLNLIGNKHVPQVYLANSRAVRLQVLAGLIDGDGSLKYHGHGYDFTATDKRIADAVMYLARSLGLWASRTFRTTACQTGASCDSYRIYIGGDCSVIPCRIARKKASPPPADKDRDRDYETYGITVTPVGVDDYYGFEIDGDRLFLLGDFTVTHNTDAVVQISVEGAELQAAMAAEIGPDRAGYWYYFSYELTEDQLRERVYAYGARVHKGTFAIDPVTRRRAPLSTADDPATLKPYESEPYINSPGNPVRGERERIRDFNRRLSGPNSRLRIIDYSGTHPGHGVGLVDEIARYLQKEASRLRRPAGVVIDYAGLAVNRYIGARGLRPDAEYSLLAGFADQVRTKVCVAFDCVGWVLHQLHGDVSKRAPGARIHHSDARGSRNFADNADFGMQLSPYNKTTGLLTVHCTKHRRAPGREEGTIIRFDGRFGVFRDPDQLYVVDPMTRQIVPRDYIGTATAGPPPAGPAPAGQPPVDPRVDV